MKRIKKLEEENKKLKEDIAYLMKNKADRGKVPKGRPLDKLDYPVHW